MTVRWVLAAALGAVTMAGCGNSERPAPAPEARESRPADVVLTADGVDPTAVRKAGEPRRPARGTVVEVRGAAPAKYGDEGSVSPGAPTDDEVRAELRDARVELAKFKQVLGTGAYAQTGPRARVLPDGTAVAPANAPDVVKQVIQAANAIATTPYKWGGGHGAWRDNGYDCSGSVSFALAGAGLLKSPRASGGFMSYGAPGPGKWITIHADPGHMYMVVAGLRFDTSGANGGTRWQAEPRGMSGLQVRHVPGL
ncbi:MAG: hypothetical protein WKF32_06825 [Thermoleophilaceae bacterium]